MPFQILQNAAFTGVYFLGASASGYTSCKISKNGAAFATPGLGTVASIANGFFSVALNVTDTNTLGPLAIHFIGGTSGTDPEPDQVFIATLSSTLGVNVIQWKGSIPASLDASGNVPANTLAWNGTAPANLDANNLVQVDVERWSGDSVNKLVSGDVKCSVDLWLGTAPHALDGNGYVYADVGAWLATVPAALDANGFVAADTEAWFGSLTNPLSGGSPLSVNVIQWLGNTPAALDGSGYLEVDVVSWRGTTPSALDGSGNLKVDLQSWLAVPPQPLDGAGYVLADVESWKGLVPAGLDGSGNIPSDVLAMSAGVQSAIATTLLTQANGVETGLTVQQVLRVLASACGGTCSFNAGTSTWTFKSAGGAVTRIVAVTDTIGERTSVTLTP
jgi:hypothetical protein